MIIKQFDQWYLQYTKSSLFCNENTICLEMESVYKTFWVMGKIAHEEKFFNTFWLNIAKV